MVAAPLAAVVALTEAMVVLLPCAAATVARLAVTLPEVEDTVEATVAVVAAAAASSLTEQRLARTKIDTLSVLRSQHLQTPCGKSPGSARSWRLEKEAAVACTCVLGKRLRDEEFLLFYYLSCVCYSS